MDKMKKEDIDNLIAESFIETNSCDIWQAFLDNMDNMEASLKKDNADIMGNIMEKLNMRQIIKQR